MPKNQKVAKAADEGRSTTNDAPLRLQSQWPARLIITAEQTPSGTRYEVTVGQIIEINEADYEFLSNLKRNQSGCCGGVPNPPPVHLFNEVK